MVYYLSIFDALSIHISSVDVPVSLFGESVHVNPDKLHPKERGDIPTHHLV